MCYTEAVERTRLFDGFSRYVGLDTETTDYRGHGSLDWRTGGVALIQVKIDDGEPQLLRPTKENLFFVRNLVSDPETLVVMHNAKFDLKFLANLGIFPRNLFDTQIASELLYAGLHTPDEATKSITKIKRAVEKTNAEELFDSLVLDKVLNFKETKSSRFSNSLAAALKREMNILIPKDMQTSDWAREPLSAAQKEYAANDVRYIITLGSILAEKLKRSDLTRVALLEMEFIKPLALLEFVGVQIDVDEWKETTKKLKEELNEVKKELEEKFGNLIAEREGRVGLFGLVPEAVNLNSSSQMAKILGLPDVQADTLAKIESSNPLVAEFLDYKKLVKLVTTYGEAYLNSVGDDGRLRTDFTQTSVATGRLSSRSPNLQNVPPDFIKAMLRAPDDYIVVAADYSQVELRILAMLASDERFIKATLESDLHSATARQIFGVPEDEDVPSELRRKAKCVHPATLVEVEDFDGVRRILPIEEFDVHESNYDEFVPLNAIKVSDADGYFSRIRNLYKSIPSQMVVLVSEAGITITTPRHMLYSQQEKKLKEAELFQEGDVLATEPPRVYLDDFSSTGFTVDNAFVEVTEELAEMLGREFANPAEAPIEKLIQDEFSAELIRQSVEPFRVPVFVMQSKPVLAAYIRGVKKGLSPNKSGTKIGNKTLPLHDEAFVFVGQIVRLSHLLGKGNYVVPSIVHGTGSKVIRLAFNRSKISGEITYKTFTEGVYDALDFETETHTFVINGFIGKNTVNFGIPYGVSAQGLVARGYFQELQDAEKVLKMWKEEAFPDAWKFLEKSGRDAVEHGASFDAIGRRRNYEVPPKPQNYDKKKKQIKDLNKRLDEYGYSTFELKNFESWKELQEDEEIPDEVKKLITRSVFLTMKEIRKYEATVAAIRRQGQNMPIQATSASITKQALVDIYEDALQDGRYSPTLTIHDSIFFEVLKEDAVEIANKIKALMERAAKKILPGIVAPVDVDFGWKEEYKCAKCGEPVKKFNMYVEDGVLKEVDPSTVLCEQCSKEQP